MANVSIDLGFFSLIIVTTLFANGSSSSKDVYQRKEIQMAKLNVLSLWDGIKSGNICSTCDQSGARKRSKRCTCYSYRDKECVYYCHLDIIWVNTPEHTLPYGMSSYGGSQRMRRSAPTERRRGGEGGGGTWTGSQRCVCLQQIDSECSSFCIPTGNRGHKQTSGELHFPVDIFSSPGTDT